MTVQLSSGSHDRRVDGMCAMEAAAYIAGERHTDHPVCVSPVIASYLRSWNDGLPTDGERNRLLKPLLSLVLHTATSTADEEVRAWLATDWLVRVQTPAWLDLAKLPDQAHALRRLPLLTSSEIATACQSVIEEARSRADAARAAAWAAAGAAARAAAWAAAGAAARAAAWAAAGAAARAAAWAAARAAAGAAAWAAARAAAGDAAWAAARDAAWAAARAAAWAAARDAAWAAARDALAPTIVQLQESAVDLVRRMVAVGEVRERPMRADRWKEICAECV